MSAREAARALAQRLIDAGHRTLFAGGCVRDELMGIEDVVDFDIATSAKPEEIKQIFPKARGVGEAFGVMLVRHHGHTFEVATFRKDGQYQDGRRPTTVTFSDEVEDAQRRDFTINGIFAEPKTGEPVDHVLGRADIAAKLIRAIGDPHARIAEDRLRMLRALRFAARFNFAIEPATSAAVRAHSNELLSVSPERVGEEVRKMLQHPARHRAATLIEEHALDAAIFGGGSSAGPLARVNALANTTAWTTVLAAWLLDRLDRPGRRDGLDGPGRRDGLDGLDGLDRPDRTLPQPTSAERALMVGELRRRLTLSNHDADGVAHALDAREALLAGFDALEPAARVRLMAGPGFDTALEILHAELPADAARWKSQADATLPERALPEPLVDGNALVAEGMRPGPRFKVLLDLAMDAQIEGRVTTRAQALELVRHAATTLGSPKVDKA